MCQKPGSRRVMVVERYPEVCSIYNTSNFEIETADVSLVCLSPSPTASQCDLQPLQARSSRGDLGRD